jgi:multiple sugar transport system substrate-binding protein
MKKFQKVFFAVLSVLVIASMVGCGTTTTPAPTEAQTTGAATEAPTTVAPTAAPTEIGVEGCRIAAPDKPVTINVIGWSYPIIDFYFKELEKCNGVKNITINTQLLDSGSAHDKIKLAAAAGGESTYDIILNDGGWVPTLADMNALYPLDDLIAKYDTQYNISDIVGWPDATYQGVRYAVPIENNTELFFYNAEVFDKYGLKAPDTWDDVINACNVLRADKDLTIPGTITLYAGWAWDLEFSQMLGAQGVRYLDDNYQPLFNGPEGVAAANKLIEVAKACNGDVGMPYSIDNSEVAMETGTMALSFTWASRGANMDNPEKSQFVGKINFSPAPRFTKGGIYGAYGGGASFSIMAGSKVDKDLLFRIIMEATDYDSQVEAAKLGIASRQAVSTVATARYYAASMETIAGGIPSSYNPASGIAGTALSNWLPLAFSGQYTVQEALDKAAAEYIEQAKAAGFIK